MSFSRSLHLADPAIVIAWLCLLSIGSVHAAITPTGDFTSIYNGTDDPWNVTGGLTVGDTGSGSLAIDSGSTVTSYSGWIGDGSSSTGVVSVAGADSEWSNVADLYIGRYGNGT